MPNTNTSRERYMVAQRTQGDLLSKLAAQFHTDPEIAVLDKIGPAEQPDTLVVSMTPDRARQLKADYAGKLIVEKDAPLTAF
jgi:hypothetical protein